MNFIFLFVCSNYKDGHYSQLCLVFNTPGLLAKEVSGNWNLEQALLVKLIHGGFSIQRGHLFLICVKTKSDPR